MKIFSGELRGLVISAPQGSKTRPTSSRVREAAMNIVFSRYKRPIFYDFFSGSGAMGLEAISRGAKGCLLIEKDLDAFKCLSQNTQKAMERLKGSYLEPEFITLLQQDVKKSIKFLRHYKPADIVWADPPYAVTLEWLDFFSKYLDDITSQDAMFLMEMDLKTVPHAILNIASWQQVATKRYGSISIVVWQKKGGEHAK